MSDNKSNKKKFSRRKFLIGGAAVLGGTIVATYFGRGPIRRYLAETIEDLDFPSSISTYEPTFWFEILADNTILMKSPKVEMGQGIFTGFALMAAEELEVSPDQIKVEHASTASGVVDNLSTGGSNTTSSLFIPIREVAATMRETLKLAAAKKWNVDVTTVAVQQGLLTSGENKITYAELSASVEKWEIADTPVLKPASEFKYVGSEMKRIDLKPKVFGKPVFAIDASLPEMLYAVVLHSPYIGGVLRSIDIKEAANSPGVIKVVEEKDLIAVVAANRYAAEIGLRKIKAEWAVPSQWQQADFEKIITAGNGSAVRVQKEGAAESMIEENKTKTLRQEYRTAMAAHAHMEPNGAIVYAEKDKATVIIGTQGPNAIRSAVASALDIDSKNVNVEVAYSGGAFGRRMDANNAVQAARLSRLTGKPVQVFNTREQEFQNGVYRPGTHHVIEAVVNAAGEVEAITHNQATADMILASMIPGGAGNALLGADFISAGHGAGFIYNFKNKSATVWDNKLPIPTGIWRSVGMLPNTFAIESFINELAHGAGQDPIDFRLKLLNGSEKIHQRYKTVLETLREKSGWNSDKPAGTGRGMAFCNDRKTLAAAVIEVVIIDGRIKVTKVTNVIDAGLSVNPEGIRMQVEGCMMMGITAALYEELTVKDSQITASNFHQYPMSMLMDTPAQTQTIILQGDDKPYGVGEPPIAPIAPAIAAAVFEITGQRLRSLPLKVTAG